MPGPRRVPEAVVVVLLGVLLVGSLLTRAGVAAETAVSNGQAWLSNGQAWQWPLPEPERVVRGFAPPAHDWLPGHRGVDLAGRAGEPVRAAGAGVVGFAGVVAGIGVVTIDHGALRTTYQPLRPAVHPGEQVAAGELIGHLVRAGSHCLPAACLHWGLLRGASYLDPLALLGLAQVRLLPVSGLPPVRVENLYLDLHVCC